MQKHTKTNASPHYLNCGGKILDLSSPQVMGVLNITPNSFSTIGRFMALDQALKHAENIFKQGATIIDVGGEPTNPGVHPVISEQQELDRVIPIVEAISRELPIIISVDTSKPNVMQAAIAKGAGFINDVRALQNSDTLAIIAASGIPVCLMHMAYPNGNTNPNMAFQMQDDPVSIIKDFLHTRINACLSAGISKKQIVIDPGIGQGNFGKSQKQNLQLINQLDKFKTMNFPILLGVSRKTFIGEILNAPPEARLYGSLAAATIGVIKGAAIIRAHDVQETVEAIKVAWAIISSAL